MENSEGKTGLARIQKSSANEVSVTYDSKVVVFATYTSSAASASVEYRSAETMKTLTDLISKAQGAKGTLNEKLTDDALENYLNEIISTMEILDIQ